MDTHDSAQLDLWEADLRKMPWRGRSPRDLTRSRKALYLNREGQKAMVSMKDPRQLEFWPIDCQSREMEFRGLLPSELPSLLDYL